jgi:hypothetical protein
MWSGGFLSTNYEVNFGFKINLREVIPLLQLPSSINKEKAHGI